MVLFAPLVLFLFLELSVEQQQAECLIPPGPPCLPFSDPRWSNPDCEIPTGACFYLLTGTKQRAQVSAAVVTISPVCDDPGSHKELRDAAIGLLYGLQGESVEVVINTAKCSGDGYADIQVSSRGGLSTQGP